MNVEVFFRNNCIQCKTVKCLLAGNQTAFEETNIDEQPEVADWLKAQGSQSVPVITSDAETVIGFCPDQLCEPAS